ncbi:hypothetical protein B0H94_106120 [Salsuginibacillus halophilus]|uniref:YwgA family protein n=1 Tax=Salsuginibacillus halophilus TaxID=517424 RepID=A0A2P8HI10_9BACI|nr:hypothetical protein [Salsuginibacillus halophilus]PSL45865.1 hypothetical protein B0H94_106120 [Salsuginibacillus halophilus]
MLQEHAKLMALFQAAGEVVGRKKLQKIVYISKKFNAPFQERYNFHMFGPYSEELTLRVEELNSLGFVEEVREQKSGYYQYRYSLTPEGQTFLNQHQSAIVGNDTLFCRLNDNSSKFLELVSTILYFDDLTEAEVRDKVHTLKKKQNYSDEDFEEAYAFIDELTHLH